MRFREAGLGILAVAALGCGTAGSDVPEPVAPAAASQPAADPRISEMQVLLAELLDRMEVLNARLQRIESATPAAAAVSVPAPVLAPSQPASRTASSVPVAPSRPLTGAAMADKYRAALALYGKGSLDQARKLFQEVLDADPNGELADNALYWMGETHFVSGRYADAMNFYRRILKDYSDQNKAPDAMLKMGLAYVKLGDLGLARTTFQQLIEKYPYSTPASAAKAEIKRIKY
jgi:tol-pal system protein YbgF